MTYFLRLSTEDDFLSLFARTDVICNITIYIDDNTLYSKCDQAADLWKQLELASKLESDLQDTVDWGRNGLLISILEKLNLFHLTAQDFKFSTIPNIGLLHKILWKIIFIFFVHSESLPYP